MSGHWCIANAFNEFNQPVEDSIYFTRKTLCKRIVLHHFICTSFIYSLKELRAIFLTLTHPVNFLILRLDIASANNKKIFLYLFKGLGVYNYVIKFFS